MLKLRRRGLLAGTLFASVPDRESPGEFGGWTAHRLVRIATVGCKVVPRRLDAGRVCPRALPMAGMTGAAPVCPEPLSSQRRRDSSRSTKVLSVKPVDSRSGL